MPLPLVAPKRLLRRGLSEKSKEYLQKDRNGTLDVDTRLEFNQLEREQQQQEDEGIPSERDGILEGDQVWRDETPWTRLNNPNSHFTEMFSPNWQNPQKEFPPLPDNQRWLEEGNGEVKVSAYNRSTGDVRGHTRTKPDGHIHNNLSYRTKR